MYARTLSFIFVLLLSACGGGGSSSGSGAAAQSQLAYQLGIYGGSQSIAFIAPDGERFEDRVGFEANVTNANIEILDGSLTDRFGVIAPGGSFSVPKAILNQSLPDGITCRGEIGYIGDIQVNQMSGRIQGSVNCEGVTFRFEGTFEATLGAPAFTAKRSSSQSLEAFLARYR